MPPKEHIKMRKSVSNTSQPKPLNRQNDGFLLGYNIIMKQNRHSSKKSQTKVKYTFNPKSNVLFEDNASDKVKVKFIIDKKEPFYKHEMGENGGSNNN